MPNPLQRAFPGRQTPPLPRLWISKGTAWTKAMHPRRGDLMGHKYSRAWKVQPKSQADPRRTMGICLETGRASHFGTPWWKAAWYDFSPHDPACKCGHPPYGSAQIMQDRPFNRQRGKDETQQKPQRKVFADSLACARGGGVPYR